MTGETHMKHHDDEHGNTHQFSAEAAQVVQVNGFHWQLGFGFSLLANGQQCFVKSHDTTKAAKA